MPVTIKRRKIENKQKLDVGKILADFRKAEQSTSRRKGTFKIDVPFDEALKTILKSK